MAVQKMRAEKSKNDIAPTGMQWAAAIILALTLVLFTRAIPARYEQLNQMETRFSPQTGKLGSMEAAALKELGFSIPIYAGYVTLVESLTAFVGIGVGLVIFWRKRNDRMALFVSVALATFSTSLTPLMTYAVEAGPFWSASYTLLRFISLGPSFLIFLIFPDGRFVPGWTKWFGAAWLVYNVTWLFFPALGPPSTLVEIGSTPVVVLYITMTGALVGCYGQIVRYRRHSNPVQRQQTKWIMLGFSQLLLVLTLFSAFIQVSSIQTPTPAGMVYLLVCITATLVSLTIAPLAVMASILHYHLWDIDVIIRRTLSYSILSGTLGVVYFGGAVTLQSIFGRLSAQSSAISVVLSTLAIAALFNPLRWRIQEGIDRRFYRQKYDAEKLLASFAQSTRNATEVERLSDELTEAVCQAIQPENASLWYIKPGMRKR